MKKYIPVFFVLFMALLASLPSLAQLRKIPAEATQALREKYPGADHISWKDKLTVFAASFDMDNQKYEARFDDKGQWKSTEKEITEADLPGDVQDGFDKSKYADWGKKNIYEVELPDEVIQYRIHIAKNDIQKKNLLFTSEGQLLKDNITFK
ncbi:MAG: PepSY-like domain-containing protein [Bacteroidetes bacterium]|nr:PepSY-like domain-containing protein [Bacteroidota bacterium]